MLAKVRDLEFGLDTFSTCYCSDSCKGPKTCGRRTVSCRSSFYCALNFTSGTV